MRYALLPLLCLLPLSGSALAEDEGALGAIPALSGSNTTTSGVTVLPQNQLNQNSRRLSPVLVIPPESLESRTLVVPLPSEKSQPVVIRGNKALEATPSIQPAMPKSSAGNNNAAKSKPLDPVVD